MNRRVRVGVAVDVMADDPDELFALTYDTLKTIARRLLSGRHGTLQPTALVHEAWLKLSQGQRRYVDQAHFTAVAVRALRQVLIDHARARATSKRGGALERTTLDLATELSVSHDASVELLMVEQLLTRLEALDARQARIVELRIYGGLELEEIASLLGVSLSTVEREWRKARAWIVGQLGAPS